MKKLTLITVIAMFAILGASIAQPMHGKGMGRGKGMMGKFPGIQFYEMNSEELKLEDSQIQKMEVIDDNFQKERIEMQSKIKLSSLEMKKEMDKKSVNKDALLKKQDDIQNLKNTMQKKALSYKLDLYNVMTDDQKSNMDNVRKNCMKQGMGMMRGSGRGNCGGTVGGRGPGSGNCMRGF